MKKFKILIISIILISCADCDKLFSIDFFKKNTITLSDKKKYKDAYRDFSYRVINEASRMGDEVPYVEPRFENINIPDELLKKFTLKALRKDFDTYDFDGIFEIFKKTIHPDNYSWSIGSKILPSEYYIEVELHNFHRWRGIHSIILTVTGIGDFQLMTNERNAYGYLQLIKPMSDGTLIAKINYDTYNRINKGNKTARIKRIFYWYKI